MTFVKDAKKLKSVPPQNLTKAMLSELKKLESDNKTKYCVEIYDLYFDATSLESILHVYRLERAKYQMDEENLWVFGVSQYYNRPAGVPTVDPSLAPLFLSIIQGDPSQADFPDFGVDIGSLKQLASKRWISDEIIDQISNIINVQSTTTCAVYFNY